MMLIEWVGRYANVRGQPFSFIDYRFLRKLYQDESRHVVVQKASQVGVSELMVNTAFWFADQKGGNVLYAMPTQSNMDDFSRARVSPRLEGSQYLVKRCLNEYGKKTVDNVRLRKLGTGYIYFRGSDQPRQIITIDADLLIRDELDWMTPDNVPMMEKRLGASQFKWIRDVSTPSYPGVGVEQQYSRSTMFRYLIQCEACNEWQELDFFENIKYKTDDIGEPLDAWCVCSRCGKPLDRLKPGEWVADYPNRAIHGYKINKLYYSRSLLIDLVAASLRTSESAQQIFYNFDLGLARSPKGGKVSRELILACRDMDYTMPLVSDEPTSAGIDVGSVINVRISQITPQGRRAVYIGAVKTFEEVSELMTRFNCCSICIDALPETRKVKEFADQFEGKVFMVYFTSQKEMYRHKVDNDGYRVLDCSRVMLLDELVAEFGKAQNILPRNVDEIKNYINQVTALTRVIEQDSKGRDIPKWVSSGPDHYAFAEVYDLLAGKVFEQSATISFVASGLDKPESNHYTNRDEREAIMNRRRDSRDRG